MPWRNDIAILVFAVVTVTSYMESVTSWQGVFKVIVGFYWGALCMPITAFIYGLLLTTTVHACFLLVYTVTNSRANFLQTLRWFTKSPWAFVLKCLLIEWAPFWDGLEVWHVRLRPNPDISEAFLFGQLIGMIMMTNCILGFGENLYAGIVHHDSPAVILGLLRMHGFLRTPPGIVPRNPHDPLDFVRRPDGLINREEVQLRAVTLVLVLFFESLVETGNSVETSSNMAIAARWPRQFWDAVVRSPSDAGLIQDTSHLGKWSIPLLSAVCAGVCVLGAPPDPHEEPVQQFLRYMWEEGSILVVWQITNLQLVVPEFGRERRRNRLRHMITELMAKVPVLRRPWRNHAGDSNRER